MKTQPIETPRVSLEKELETDTLRTVVKYAWYVLLTHYRGLVAETVSA